MWRNFREASENDDALRVGPDLDSEHAGAKERDQWRVVGEHAEVAFHAWNVDLIDLAGKQQLVRAQPD